MKNESNKEQTENSDPEPYTVFAENTPQNDSKPDTDEPENETEIAGEPAKPETSKQAGKNNEQAEEETDPVKQLQEKETVIQESFKQLLRLKAEFDNYRKRVEKEKEQKFLLGKEAVLIKTVDLLDIFEKAMEAAKKSHNIKDTLHGLDLLKKEFSSFLEKEGVKPINSVGEKFNPVYHDVLGTEVSDCGEDVIIKEVQKGYIFNDCDIIRSAKVIISKPKKKGE